MWAIGRDDPVVIRMWRWDADPGNNLADWGPNDCEVVLSADGSLPAGRGIGVRVYAGLSSSAADRAADNVMLGDILAISTPPECYALTLSHSGLGSDPYATPSNSVGCLQGEYVAGEIVQLSAVPDADWRVDSWSGTDNDGSMSTENSVTMPAAAHDVSVTYTDVSPECYALTLSHSGAGSDPYATPIKSAGCADGEYVAGEIVQLSAVPDAGWRVDGWSGTDNDSSTSVENTVTMPAAVHSTAVSYIESAGRLYESGFDGADSDDLGADWLEASLNFAVQNNQLVMTSPKSHQSAQLLAAGLTDTRDQVAKLQVVDASPSPFG